MENDTVHKPLQYSNTILNISLQIHRARHVARARRNPLTSDGARNEITIVTKISSNLRKLMHRSIQLQPLLHWKVRRHSFTINILFKTHAIANIQPSTNPIQPLLIYILKNHFYDTRAVSPHSVIYMLALKRKLWIYSG